MPSAPDVPSTATAPSRLAIMHSPTHGLGPERRRGRDGRSTAVCLATGVVGSGRARVQTSQGSAVIEVDHDMTAVMLSTRPDSGRGRCG